MMRRGKNSNQIRALETLSPGEQLRGEPSPTQVNTVYPWYKIPAVEARIVSRETRPETPVWLLFPQSLLRGTEGP